MDEKYDTDIFTDPTIKGRLGVNAMKAKRHLYNHVVYDSTNELEFATELDSNNDVAVYVKLPDGFYISTQLAIIIQTGLLHSMKEQLNISILLLKQNAL